MLWQKPFLNPNILPIEFQPGRQAKKINIETRRTSIQTLKSGCDVLSIRFQGSNSDLFQRASRLAVTLRLGLYMHEIRRRLNILTDLTLHPLLVISVFLIFQNQKRRCSSEIR